MCIIITYTEEIKSEPSTPRSKKKQSPMHMPVGPTASMPVSRTMHFPEALSSSATPQSARVPKYVRIFHASLVLAFSIVRITCLA